MTEFIGQIALFIDACDMDAEQRLRRLAYQLEDDESDIQSISKIQLLSRPSARLHSRHRIP